MSTKGYVLKERYLRSRETIPMFLDGYHEKLLQAALAIGAQPVCFTSTGMVIYFQSKKQFIDFKDSYFNDDEWSYDEWTSVAKTHKKYRKWILALEYMDEYKSTKSRARYTNRIQNESTQLSCPESSGWSQLEKERVIS